MGHSRQTNTVKIPLDLVIKPRCFFYVSAFSLLIRRQRRQKRERSICGLFNRVSVEFAGTCCAHRTACFSTAVPLREDGGLNWDIKMFVFFKRWTRLRSSVVMLLREYSRGDRLSSYTALSCRKYTSKNVSQLQGSLVTLLLKAIHF